MNHISLDIETYSSVDLNKSSVYRYSEAPDFEILLFGYSVDDNPVQVVDLASGERIPEEILAALTDERVTKWAFNANFERVCLSRYLGMPNDEFLDPAQWRCTMIWSAYLGLPLSLMGVGAALALDKQKMSEGKELIRYFCQPCAATKANGGRTCNLPQDAPEKWTLFKAYNLRDVETEMGIQKRLRRHPVPEDVWAQYHQDQAINDRGIAIDRQLVDSAIQMDMRSRTELTEQMQKLTCLENPNSVQQMKKWLSELIRTAFVPSAGKKLIVSDFSAVEARVIAWLAGEQWRMEVFAHGGDIYCASASQMFGVPVEKHGVNGHLRQKGKIAELALGYGGSVGALKAMGALEMGLTEEELPTLVRQWRNANPHITRLWWDVDEAVMTAVRDKTSTYAHGIRFHVQSGMLFIHLPSGRDLCYAKPRIGENQFGSPAVTYMGVGATKKWERIESYGPKFVENIVQGISRDLLCYAMRTLRCCDIVAHVHDEIILEADPRVSLDAVCEQMGRTPPWAKGLVLRADGYECAFYKKD